MTLGETICRLRTERGLSQEELAEALEVSRQSVSKWETDASVPDLDRLVRLAGIFQVSLDRLVTGKEADSPAAGPAAPVSAPAPAPQRTRAQTAGVFLLCFTAAAALLLVLFFGPAGALFTLPTLAAGLICLLARRHPVLKTFWTLFLILDAYSAYATGIRAGAIVLTFKWTPELNYFRLAFAWALFFMIAALVAGTALTLRKDGWHGTRREKLITVLTAVCLVLTFIPLRPEVGPDGSGAAFLHLVFLLNAWLQLGAIAVLATVLARFLHSRGRRQAA